MKGKNDLITLAIYSVNPVQYHAPIFRNLEKDNTVDFKVLFGSEIGKKPFFSKELNTTISWDIPIVDGYKHKFFWNLVSDKRRGTFSRINPGMFFDILIHRYDALLIHGYDTVSSWIVFIAAKLSGTKIIWRGEAAIRPVIRQNKFKKFIKERILPNYFKSVDAVMYSCSGNKQYLKQFGVCEEKMFLIPCAVDNDFFRKERKKIKGKEDNIREKLNIPKTDFIVAFSARFTTRKRPLDLIEAVARIEHSDITLLFIGDGLLRDEMENLSAKYGIKTVFTGFKGQKQLAKYYSIADLFVVISDYDASPKALNEALNFELPIIVSDKVGTANDLVKEDVNGFIVKSRDVDGVSSKIDILNKDRLRAKKMGSESLEISNEWSIDNDIVGIKKALEYVLR